MRLAVLTFFVVCLAGCATLDPLYTDPASSSDHAVLVKEYCVGLGRGLVHFEGIDSTTFKKFQIQKLLVAPGQHTVKVLYMAPGARFDIVGSGKVKSLPYYFAPNSSYIVKYKRTDPSHYRVWIEPISAVQAQVANSVCTQPAFGDHRYWQ